MKLSCVITICPLVVASAMVVQLSHTTFESCDPNNWIMSNTTTQWINNTKIMSCVITYKQNNEIYKISITIGNCNNHTMCTGDCKNNTVCTGEPIVKIENIDDCDTNNLSRSNLEVCKIAEELANIEKEKNWLKDRYGSTYGMLLSNLALCLVVDDNNVSWN